MSDILKLYSSPPLDYAELEKLERTHVCGECGSFLTRPWSPKYDAVILVCAEDPEHRGYKRPPKLFNPYSILHERRR